MSPALTAGAKIYKNYSLLLELVEAAAASALPPTAARLVRLKRAAHVNRQSLPSLYYQLFPEKPATQSNSEFNRIPLFSIIFNLNMAQKWHKNDTNRQGAMGIFASTSPHLHTTPALILKNNPLKGSVCFDLSRCAGLKIQRNILFHVGSNPSSGTRKFNFPLIFQLLNILSIFSLSHLN